MPTYQYACTECGHRLEAVQSFSDAALTECPACAGRLRKVFNSVGIVFKGSGFYRTDSRSKDGAADGAKDGAGKEAGGKDPGGNGPAKGDTSAKPAASPAGGTSAAAGAGASGSSSSSAA